MYGDRVRTESGCVITEEEVKGRRRGRFIVGGWRWVGGAAVQRWELFNWRVTLGAWLVSSSPSITRGQEMPEVMWPASRSLRIPRPTPAFNRQCLHYISFTSGTTPHPVAPSSKLTAHPTPTPPHQDALTSAHLAYSYLLPCDSRLDGSFCSQPNKKNREKGIL